MLPSGAGGKHETGTDAGRDRSPAEINAGSHLPASHHQVATTNSAYVIALSRAFAGALIFCLPLLMTMEMWWLGFTLEPWRLAQFIIANLAVLYGMSKVAGFEESHNRIDDILDAFAAYLVAVVTVTIMLSLIGAIRPQMTVGEIAGIIAIQAVPASFGAMVGAKLMGDGEAIEQSEHWRRTYSGRLFLFLAGALFLSFTVAPTEEMILISFKMSPWQSLVMLLGSILLLHAILYVVEFRGQAGRAERSHGHALLRQTLPGYTIAITASLYLMWSFGRLDGLGLAPAVMAAIVLALPASIGAGIARIVI